jgi:hypothetical protein
VIGRRLQVGRLRAAGLAAGCAAGLVMIAVGCQSVTQGGATVDAADPPVYRASVSLSSEEAAASSSTQESERQSSLTTKAVHTACEALSSTSVDAIAALNGYVASYNDNAPDVVAKAVPAIDALNRSADLVAGSISGPLSPELRAALTGWVDAARTIAGAVASDAGMGEFNAAVGRLNDSQEAALHLCDAAY